MSVITICPECACDMAANQHEDWCLRPDTIRTESLRNVRRYEIAKAVMAGFAGSETPPGNATVAAIAVSWADALLEELGE